MRSRLPPLERTPFPAPAPAPPAPAPPALTYTAGGWCGECPNGVYRLPGAPCGGYDGRAACGAAVGGPLGAPTGAGGLSSGCKCRASTHATLRIAPQNVSRKRRTGTATDAGDVQTKQRRQLPGYHRSPEEGPDSSTEGAGASDTSGRPWGCHQTPGAGVATTLQQASGERALR